MQNHQDVNHFHHKLYSLFFILFEQRKHFRAYIGELSIPKVFIISLEMFLFSLWGQVRFFYYSFMYDKTDSIKYLANSALVYAAYF